MNKNMNKFEELCKLASDEDWCWNLFCTTCGHMHFRYAFSELAAGLSPAEPAWIIHGHNTKYSHALGSLPIDYAEEQKEKVIKICSNANLSSIAEACKFPNWLGYLGLVLVHMFSESESYKGLSENWASQLLGLVSEGSRIHLRLTEVIEGNRILNIKDLDICETDIMRNKWMQETKHI